MVAMPAVSEATGQYHTRTRTRPDPGSRSSLVLMLPSVSLELQTISPSALPTTRLDLTSVTPVTPVTSDPEQVDSADQVAHVPHLVRPSSFKTKPSLKMQSLQYQTPTRGGATSQHSVSERRDIKVCKPE